MIRSFVFSDGRLVGRDLEPEALRLIRADPGLVLWVDLQEPTPEETKAVLEGTFGFHALAVEDCIAPNSLPKVEDYENYLFIVTHAVDFSRAEKFQTTELDMFLGPDFVVTHHTKPVRAIEGAIDRFVKNLGQPRGADRIAYVVMDLLVDNYQPVLDELRGELDEIEDKAISQVGGTLIEELIEVRSEIGLLRQIIRPQREVIARVALGESRVIRSKMLPYYRNLRDNLTRIDETAAGYADRLLICFDLHLNRSASEANEGIKILTALTAITLPVLLIGTWYGMNFEHMPELSSPYGYKLILALTVVLTVLITLWIRKKRWL
jgi:magnesium transporter